MDEDHAKYAKMIEETDKQLKGLMAKWVLRYDYFGFLFSLVRRRAMVSLPNPAAVAPTPEGKLELLYNPILLAGTSDEYIDEILHHEGLHILNKHISRMMRILADLPKSQHKAHIDIINIACDCCVNSQGKIKNPLIIAGTPFELHYPDKHGLPPERMMEEYYYILLKRMRNQGSQDGDKSEEGEKSNEDNDTDDNTEDNSSNDKNNDNTNDDTDNDEGGPGKSDDDVENPEDGKGKGGAPTDGGDPDEGSEPVGEGEPQEGNPQPSDNSDLGNHHHWNDEDIVDPHALSRQIDTYTQRVIRESARNFQRSKARGRMPGYLQDLIEAALKPVPIPYYEIIRQLVKGSKIGKYKRSSTHINRKRTYVFQIDGTNIPLISPFPGRKRDLSFKIGIIIDTSGSQTPDDIIDGLSGCKSIIEKDRHCETTLLEVDTKIHKEYEVKRIADIDFEVKGRGGTTLFPGIARCRELEVDICMCFTDGYTENFNEIDRRLFPKRMLWVITPGGSDEKLNQVGFTVWLPERIMNEEI
jgi:predicted metal-dependent peptidase